MQATNNTNASATLNGYSLTAAAPLSGDGTPSSAPLAAPGSKPQASKLGPQVGRRLLGVPTLSTPSSWGQLRSGRQQQLVLSSLSPGYAKKLQLAGLPAVVSQHTQHGQRVQQMLSRTEQALAAAAVKLADCAIAAPQHAQQMLSRTVEALKAAVFKLRGCAVVAPQQLLSSAIQAVEAACSNLADCAVVAPQHAQQLVSRTKHALKTAVPKHAGRVAALCKAAHNQGAQILGSVGSALHRRALATGTPDSVDVEVTVNVPNGQSGSATQARIEGPSFAPALQQSLSNAGTLVSMHATFCVFCVAKQMFIPVMNARLQDLTMIKQGCSFVTVQSSSCCRSSTVLQKYQSAGPSMHPRVISLPFISYHAKEYYKG